MKKLQQQSASDLFWDVVVVGGGPAGMMAAGRAAERGKKVLLLEKNEIFGKKLLITGGGRCNVTNNTPNVREMLSKYKGSDQFLFSAFSQYAVQESINFFAERKVPLKEENDRRLFPTTERAQTIWDTLVGYMKSGKVEARTRSNVVGIERAEDGFYIKLKSGETIRARACIVATGGTSHPETGSTGEGYEWLKTLGHTIIENNFALVPIVLSDAWAKKLGGVSLPDVKLTIFVDQKKSETHRGKLLFTHFGVSGPTILNMSSAVGDALAHGDVMIRLDMFPADDPAALRTRIQTLLNEESNKKIKNTLSALMPAALVGPILELAEIDGETANHSVRSEDRTRLIALLKTIPLHVKGLLGADKAVISAGGVALEEINFKTMESRIVPGLYCIGDVLNINRPSGGYSLQLCWTTGFVAGNSI